MKKWQVAAVLCSGIVCASGIFWGVLALLTQHGFSHMRLENFDTDELD